MSTTPTPAPRVPTPGAEHEEAYALVTRLLPERLQRLQRASGLPVVFGGAIRRGGQGPRLVISRLVGTHGTGLAGLVVEPGKGLGGRVLRDAVPGRVSDYAATGEITHDFDRIVVNEEHLTSVVAVPVIVGGVVAGVLYGATRDATPVGARAMRSATTVATALQRDVEAALAPHEPAATEQPDPRAALADLARLIEETDDEAVRQRLLRIHRDLGGRADGPPPEFSTLTPREVDVLRLVGAGATNVEAAAELGLSPETVKAYLRTTMRKMGASNRTTAARTALQWGLLD